MINVIICGGFGKRLWPLSRKNFPKPFLSILGEAPLFQQTINRNLNCHKHMIITNEALAYQSSYQINALHLETPNELLLESHSRNTGPAILIAALNAADDDLLIVTPADHSISPMNEYETTIKQACTLASNDIVLIGVPPTYPSSQYGYIQTENNNVVEFKEKPTEEIAKQYLASGNTAWNSGIFCFKARTLKTIYQSLEPAEYQKIETAFNNRSEKNIIDLSEVKEMSFDRGILEKTPNIKVVTASFEWSDLGNFDEIIKHNQTSETTEYNASNNTIVSDSNKTAVFHDVDDLYVVEANDSILIGKKGTSKNVAEAVGILEKSNTGIVEHSNTVYRPWGFYTVLNSHDMYKVKKITVYPHHRLSLQSHKHRCEHWVCVKGNLLITNGNEQKSISENESTYIHQGTKHRIHNKTNKIAEIIEIQYGSYLEEDDITRFESDY